jgi:hypothetical protein
MPSIVRNDRSLFAPKREQRTRWISPTCHATDLLLRRRRHRPPALRRRHGPARAVGVRLRAHAGSRDARCADGSDPAFPDVELELRALSERDLLAFLESRDDLRYS